MAEMKTANGLIIMKVNLKLGGFRIDLYRSPGEYPKIGIYAKILRGEAGGWYCNKPQASSPSVNDVIKFVDEEYGRARQRRIAGEMQQQAKRDRLNESFAPDWQDIVDHFGGDNA